MDTTSDVGSSLLETLVIYSTCKCYSLPSVRYLMRKEKEGLERVCKLLLGCNAKPLPPKQSVKFKYQIWSKLTKKFV